MLAVATIWSRGAIGIEAETEAHRAHDHRHEIVLRVGIWRHQFGGRTGRGIDRKYGNFLVHDQESVMATIIRDPIGRAAIPKLEIATGLIRVQTRGIDGVIDTPPRVATFAIIEIAEITETNNMVCNAMGYQTTCDRVK